MNDLAELIHDRLDAVDIPPPDLAAVHRQGERIRGRRIVGAVSAGIAAVVAVGLVVGQLGGGADGRDRGIEPIGRLDVSEGLRAYAAPAGEIHLGGRTFPAARLEFLDTDAAATPYGVLFYDAGRPRLLDESGAVVDLEPGADRTGFHPTAKSDSQLPLVAYGVTLGGVPLVAVRDLATGEVVARHEVPADAVIDAIDAGVVFVRTADGTFTWNSGAAEMEQLSGPKTRVADVRNGVVLYDGPAPDGPAAAAYRLVPGGIDAELTHDGGHILYWSNRLEPTDGGKPVVLDEKGAWFAVDTDGSILVAGVGKGVAHPMFDCEVPSGTCTELGPLKAEHGDPMFIGVDM